MTKCEACGATIPLKIPRTKDNILIRQFYCLMQPRKQAILKALKDSKNPLYINEIAKKIELNHRTTAFHLTDLTLFGFVKSKYELNKEGRGSRFFKITPKVKQIKRKIIKELQK